MSDALTKLQPKFLSAMREIGSASYNIQEISEMPHMNHEDKVAVFSDALQALDEATDIIAGIHEDIRKLQTVKPHKQ